MTKRNRHENYEILNLIGYGLAKFDIDFVKFLGFKTKMDFYKYIVKNNIADTIGTVKNRQDLFDPFFDNIRKGWWQKGNTYIHRKILIDSLFGSLDSKAYSNIVKLYLQNEFSIINDSFPNQISPVIKSKFKQLQVTGQEAELFFMNNYKTIDCFKDGVLEDARLFGDGYDFQIEVKNHFVLSEVKGIRTNFGSIRMTQNEFLKAKEYNDDYALIIVSNLNNIPKMNVVFNPTKYLRLTQKIIESKQYNYHSESILWEKFH